MLGRAAVPPDCRDPRPHTCVSPPASAVVDVDSFSAARGARTTALAIHLSQARRLPRDRSRQSKRSSSAPRRIAQARLRHLSLTAHDCVPSSYVTMFGSLRPIETQSLNCADWNPKTSQARCGIHYRRDIGDSTSQDKSDGLIADRAIAFTLGERPSATRIQVSCAGAASNPNSWSVMTTTASRRGCDKVLGPTKLIISIIGIGRPRGWVIPAC